MIDQQGSGHVTHRRTHFACRLLALLACAPACAAAAQWISTPEAAAADAAHRGVVLQFRRELVLAVRPAHLRVQLSADSRYVLYANGRRVAAGPSRADLAHWRYETVDLGPWLRRGANLLAAEVWSDGLNAPVAQVSAGVTAFWLQSVDPALANAVDTGPAWQVRVDGARSTGSGNEQLLRQIGPTYYVAGAPETIEGALQARDWNRATTAAGGWQAAVPAVEPVSGRQLVADPLPAMREQRVPSGRVVRAAGVAPGGFPLRPVLVPAHTQATLLVDAGRVLAAWPVLRASGGAGAELQLVYAESLYDPARPNGGALGGRARFDDRARVADGLALGLTDTWRPGGTVHESFRPLWWRVWRYLEIRVKTGDEPLQLEALETLETGYPFRQRGHFHSDDAQLDEIWQVGWRTALLDAHETYMDTAYWEQLQYLGDTRLQMLISYDVAGDARLARQALDAFGDSRSQMGLPLGAWPSSGQNLIPPFALLWIGALHDYWMHQPDTRLLVRNLPALRAVLDWYAPYLREGGVLAPTPGWPFVDWSGPLNGRAQRDGKGPDSCVIALMYVGALQQAADLEDALGDAGRRAEDLIQADRVRAGLESRCWDATRGLYADTPARDEFSQQANALAVLYDVVPRERQAEVLERVLQPGGGIAAPAGVLGTTYYFSHYLAQALEHAGLGERYLGLMTAWRRLLAQHLTTWPETPDPSRSDSHAWSAHPTDGLLTIVAGIQPAAPGFARVRVAPHLGSLRRLEATVAHPRGLIEAVYRVRGGRLAVQLRLPTGVAGEFEWFGAHRVLQPGMNRFSVVAGQPAR